MTVPNSDDCAESTKPSVLFVDDEEDVLQGIRSSLRSHRKRFDFRFAVGGDDALAQIAERRPAVIVTDMRMPGMSGAELLEWAKTASPESVRIVLTGEAGRELVLRSLPVAHQWLSKPCDRDTLLSALDAAVCYQDLLSDPSLKRAVAGIDALASPPGIYTELLALAAVSTTSIEEIALVAGKDPAIAAKLIQLANSAFSGGAPVTDLHGAIVRVGLDNLCHLVLSVELSERWGGGLDLPGLGLAANSRLSEIAAGYAAGWAPSHANVAGLAALLHNVGLLIETQAFPERLASSYSAALDAGVSLVTWERAAYGASHLELAGHLLSIWGVPSQIVLAVVGSHNPLEALTRNGTADDAVRLGVRAAQQHLGGALGSPHRAPTTPAEIALINDLLASAAPNLEASS